MLYLFVLEVGVCNILMTARETFCLPSGDPKILPFLSPAAASGCPKEKPLVGGIVLFCFEI